MALTATLKQNRALLPVIWALAWPTMLEQLLQTAVQYIDTAMVGSLGTDATAAVGATTTVGWLVGSSISALGVGFLAYISQALGAKENERARKAAAQAVMVTVVAGLLFTLVTVALSGVVPVWMQVDPAIRATCSRYFFILYLPMLPRAATIIFGSLLRAAGDSKTPMRVGVLVNLVNVVLNFFFIYPTRNVKLLSLTVKIPGAGWGVEGAAIASSIAVLIGGVCITVALWRHPSISPKGYSLRPNRQVLGPCLRVAIPNAAQRFGTSLGYVAFAAMINSLGPVSTAAHTVANTVESAFYIPGYGMQAAAATLAGNAKGAGDRENMKRLAVTLLGIEVALMMVSGGLLFAFAPDMVSLFSRDAQVILLGATILRMVAVSEPFYGVSIVLEGLMQGVGNTAIPFFFNVAGMWGVRIVGTFLCVRFFHMGLIAAWACMIVHNLLLFLCFSIYYKKGNWQNM